MKYNIYTDGATSGNGHEGAQGGWAWILLDEDDNIIAKGAGHIDNATNNICELTAVINVCSLVSSDNEFTIYSDSAYLVNCVNQKWYNKWLENGWKNSKGEDVSNKAYWVDLIKYFDDPRFIFEKVKGHSDCEYNNIVDELAQSAAEEGRKILENCNS